MATEKAAIRLTELDFDTIRDNLKNYLRSQSEFADFDFDGSGMSILLDLLSVNTHYMGYYLNMVGNESFLDTAQLRSSILSHAKAINYVPGSRQGALARLNVKATPSLSEDQDATTITLEKYTKLLGSDLDGVNHQFVTLYSNTAVKSSGAFNFANVYIKQGEVTTYQFLMSAENTTARFEIPSANVDTDSIIVTVQESSSNTDTTMYSLSEDITELTSNSTVYFLEENENLKYSLYFGDNILGKKPKNGNIVICTYLDNVGSLANNISKFTFIEPIAGEYSDNVITTTANSSYGGIDKETIEQVRFRAPYFYTTQNRCVTKTDYETLLIKDYNYIDSVSVWGGENNDPIIYGKVFISVKTKGNYALTNLEKERLKKDLIQSRNVLTVTPEIVEPDYVYITVRGQVNYDPSLTSLTSDEILELVKASIQEYNEAELNKFTSVFRKSKLQTYIENCEKSITSSDLDIFVQKRFDVDPDRAASYTISLNTPIKKSTASEKFFSYPEMETNDPVGVARNAFFEETPESLTGIEYITITNAGKSYLAAPTVTIIGDGSGATATAVIVGGRVNNIIVTNAGENYTTAVIEITSTDGSGATATAKLQSEIGTIRTIYYKTNGEKVVMDSDIGSIDYSTGKIAIDSIRIYSTTENDFYDTNELTISAPIENSNIYQLRNRILSIDDGDPRSIQIEMVSET
jgi:hypothetical protein